jgi:hypothetical protein
VEEMAAKEYCPLRIVTARNLLFFFPSEYFHALINYGQAPASSNDGGKFRL